MSKAELLHSGSRLKRALRLAELPQWRARLGEGGIAYLEACRKAERRRHLGIGLGIGAVLLVAGIATGWVDSQKWRGALSAYAETLTGQGRPLEALPFALAGVAARDVVLAGQSDRANHVLARVGNVRIATDLGPLRQFGVSADGSFLVAQDAGRRWTLYNFKPGGKWTDLPDLVGFDARGFSVSVDGAFLSTRSDKGELRLYDLNPGAKSKPFSEGALSHDGAFMIARSDDGKGTFSDLRTGKTTDLGNLRPLDDFCVSADGALLFVQGDDKRGTLYDLKAGRERKDLGLLPFFVAANDGSFLFTQIENGEGRLYDLKAGGEPKNLGPLGSFVPFQVTQRADRKETRGDPKAVGERSDPGDLRSPSRFSLSFDRTFLITHGSNGVAKLHNLKTGGKTTDLGYLGDLGELGVSSIYSASVDDTFLMTQDRNGEGTLYNLKTRGKPEDLGPLRGFLFSPDGTRLFTQYYGEDGGSFRNLNPAGGVKHLGSIRRMKTALSADSTLLITESIDRKLTLHDFKAGGKSTDLGDLGELSDFGVSVDGAFVIAQESKDDTGTVYDAKAGPVAGERRDTDLFAAVCSASGDAIRPFPANLRSDNEAFAKTRTEADRHIHDSLKGRPWNPCDWRGMLAILPDPKTADAWFEGARQWLRLIEVRYFGRTDYACEDSTLGTMEAKPDNPNAAARRAARLRMCALYGPTAENTKIEPAPSGLQLPPPRIEAPPRIDTPSRIDAPARLDKKVSQGQAATAR